jgi:glutaredoxin
MAYPIAFAVASQTAVPQTAVPQTAVPQTAVPNYLFKSKSTTMNRMSLYYFPTCPFCVRVLDVIEELGMDDIELRDKHAQPEFGRELQTATGTTMVPCLRIESEVDDRWMHESEDIVTYLQGLKN